MLAQKENSHAKEAPAKKPEHRSYGLDALRGLAIIGMVFSGVFPHEEPWPAWMFHAQVGPSDFTYNSDIPGITWVDLVFPFFLFSMGAAFPLALNKKVGAKKRRIVINILKRGSLLVFFAIVLRHTNPGFLKGEVWVNYLTGLVVFGSFFLVFMRFKYKSRLKHYTLRLLGFGLISVTIALHHYYTPLEFNLNQQDVIILVLANMAVFGALIWLFTKANLMLRLGVLAFYAGLWLTKGYEGGISEAIFHFHPSFNWFYQFAFLKYLNIIIPGTILGDLLIKTREEKFKRELSKDKLYLVFIISALVLVNLYGLFTRELVFTLVSDVILCFAGYGIVSNYRSGKEATIKKFFYWGIFWLLLGLAFEPLDGGIKKDPSSFSFWFLTSGLAFFTYIICEIIAVYRPKNIIWKNIIYVGQNPMVAYVAGSFVVLPLLYFSKITEILAYLREVNIYLGILKAIVITLCVIWLTSVTTSRKWFWKT